MKVAVLAAGDRAWDEALAAVPETDVYHSAAYHRVAEANGEGEALAFVAHEGEGLLVHPFLRRRIAEVAGEPLETSLFDAESAYGYTGPVATVSDPAFLAEAWSRFGRWCADEGVVAEFIRFDPLLGNDRLAGDETTIADDRETVVVDLRGGPDDLWRRYPSVQRNMVRRAEVDGLTARVEPVSTSGLDVFRRLYELTMERAGAAGYYRFGEAYFEALAGLGDALRLVVVEGSGGVVTAAALLLVAPGRLHYHLSASTGDAGSRSATNLLLHAAALWGQDHGCTRFHLGGGRTPDADDSLLRFKRSISRDRLTFRTGRRVHDRAAYERLCARWLERTRTTVRPPYFLLYRLPA